MFYICLIRLWTNCLCRSYAWTCYFGKACEIKTGNKTHTILKRKPDKSHRLQMDLDQRGQKWGEVIAVWETGLILNVLWIFTNQFQNSKLQNVSNSLSSWTMRSEFTGATTTKIKHRGCWSLFPDYIRKEICLSEASRWFFLRGLDYCT